jgi:hypothetical protein
MPLPYGVFTGLGFPGVLFGFDKPFTAGAFGCVPGVVVHGLAFAVLPHGTVLPNTFCPTPFMLGCVRLGLADGEDE